MKRLRARWATHLLTLWALTQAATAQAWWDLGHSALCEASLNLVRADTRTEVMRLLNVSAPDDDLEPESFGRACTWADRIKRSQPTTRTWHYLNVPEHITDVSVASRPNDGDLITALEQQTAILSDMSQSLPARAQALRWVGHLLGDLHQPMHLGAEKDWGGNKIRLEFSTSARERLGEHERETSNMHAVWDGYLLIDAVRASEQSLLELIGQRSDPNAQVSGTPFQWANQSILLARQPSVGYATEVPATQIDDLYLDDHREHALHQITLAAQRLAWWLDQHLTQETP